MKERPILFSAPMVRAILDGSKTQTRRVVKPQPVQDKSWRGGWVLHTAKESTALDSINDGIYPEVCPYGQPGDRLWVREAFWADATTKEFKWYVNDVFTPDRDCDHCRLIPSIHMPRALSRILLEVTGVRVERLQDISEADAIAEGISVWSKSERHGIKWACPPHIQTFGEGDNIEGVGYEGRPVKDPREAYRGVWSSINGAGSWEANPWVWVVEFKRVDADVIQQAA
jgi:hypothetical protein